jgi:hypothetical protein|tara:strand:- start:2730 stop:3107 length:378 start_codon:yes stop_codon:yes gene_type:complete
MSYSIPSGVKKEAIQGKELYRKFKYGGGAVTAKINGMLINKAEVSHDTAIKIHTYYRRHETVDPQGENFDNKKRPSKGYIMWKRMGGDSGHSWSRKLKRTIDSVNKQKLKNINVRLEKITNGLTR